MKRKRNSIFSKPKDKKLAKKISIKSPKTFNKSVKTLNKNGLSLKEFRALNLAKTRARLQLRRKNLSSKERKEFRDICKTKLMYKKK